MSFLSQIIAGFFTIICLTIFHSIYVKLDLILITSRIGLRVLWTPDGWLKGTSFSTVLLRIEFPLHFGLLINSVALTIVTPLIAEIITSIDFKAAGKLYNAFHNAFFLK